MGFKTCALKISYVKDEEGMVYPMAIQYPDEKIVTFDNEKQILDMSGLKEYEGSKIMIYENGLFKKEQIIKCYAIVNGIGTVYLDDVDEHYDAVMLLELKLIGIDRELEYYDKEIKRHNKILQDINESKEKDMIEKTNLLKAIKALKGGI